MEENLEKIFLDISIEEKTVKNIIKNAKVSQRLKELIELGEIKTADKNVGNLLYNLSTKLPEHMNNHSKLLVEYIRDAKITTADRLAAAINSLKTVKEVDVEKFEQD